MHSQDHSHHYSLHSSFYPSFTMHSSNLFSAFSLLPLIGLLHPVAAQFPPAQSGLQTVQSKAFPGASISFKETTICETTDGVKGYSGYVHLPASAKDNRSYDINTFFWFFEARENPKTAPLSLWLQGGPGVPSIPAALGENGPCSVQADSRSTALNPWSWNQKVNMLYIDQPVQVGFSYDSLTNGTIDQIVSPVIVTKENFTAGVPKTNDTFYVGTFPSQQKATTANTTTTAVHAVWQFMQAWIQDFPHYQANDGKLSIWTESYGGHYGPALGEHFDAQNRAIRNGSAPNGSVPLKLQTLGIVNGCIDAETQLPWYPYMAYNNTYDLHVINQSQAIAAAETWPRCEALVQQCHQAYYQGGLAHPGANETVNKICQGANDYCFANLWLPFVKTGTNYFDLRSKIISSFPPKYAAGYLNNATIQAALGVPLNFTGQANSTADAFAATGDFIYPGGLDRLAGLLDRGVKVALVYGDADFQCNWLGGEQVSLSLKSGHSHGFSHAGYANLSTNATYVGGMVRQFGNLSFTRVFDSGHEVPYYQPETAYRIFDRVMFDRDVATGNVSTACRAEEYATKGEPCVAHIKNKVPPQTPPQCYVWDVLETCAGPQRAMLMNGTAVVRDFIVQ